METVIARVLRFEPIADAQGTPPAGFHSITLLTAPGYREAYRALLLLSLGLRLDQGSVSLSLKEVSELYEIWCYLTVVLLVARALEQPVPTERALAIRTTGTSTTLVRGRDAAISFPAGPGRRVTVCYNPTLATGAFAAQRPDIVVTIECSNGSVEGILSR
jgi:uncharacterized protein